MSVESAPATNALARVSIPPLIAILRQASLAAALHANASRFRWFEAPFRNLRPKRDAIRQGTLLGMVTLVASAELAQAEVWPL
jgi:hypothetical protein